nr:ribose-phosphate pyrophosphokinase 1 [Quercus suber]
MLANLMNVAGVTHVITVDLHASQMQGFFKCPVDNLVAEPLLSKWIKMNVPDWKEGVVVSKNPGGTKRVTSLADALKLSFGIVTTDRRRPHMMSSMYGSAIFEAMGTDGTNDASGSQADAEEADAHVYKYERNGRHTPIEHDFARPPTSYRVVTSNEKSQESHGSARSRAGSGNMSHASRARLNHGMGEGLMTPSPLSRSTQLDSPGTAEIPTLSRIHTVPGVSQPSRDEDGYEEPEGEDDEDERARDVTTGRLISGHIVDDAAPSPSISATNSVQGNHSQRHSSDEEPPDNMLQSFMSTASSRFQGMGHGLGGTGDATASDEEEEEALQNPEIESTITLVGNVRHRPVFIIDDMIDKSGSWIAAAETVRKRGGATKVYCMATHGLFGGNSLRELDECDDIEAIVVTDAFPIPADKRRGIKKLMVLDVSGILAEAIRRNKHGESISQLYMQFD